MQSHHKTTVAALTIVMFLMGMRSIQAQEKNIDIKILPKAVTAAFQKTYPKATITGAATEVEDSKSMFEVESRDGAINRDLLFTDNGEIFEIEETITPETLPVDIKSALEKRFTMYQLIKAEKVTLSTKIDYELKVKSHKKTYAVVLDSSAKIIKSEIVSAKKEKKEQNENDKK